MRQVERKTPLVRLNLSKFAEILGEFAATERRYLEVDTSRGISTKILWCDQSRASSSKVGDEPEKFRLYTTNRSFEQSIESLGRGTCVLPESKKARTRSNYVNNPSP